MPRASAAGVASDDAEVIAPKSFEAAKVEQEQVRLSLIDQMRDHFRGQPKRRVKVRNDGDVFVQVNGYSFVIAANQPVDVPEEIAQLLEQADYI